MGKLIVPSDITLLEEQQTVGRRRLRLAERIGLLLMPPVFHISNYSKGERSDFQQVLQRQYSSDSGDPANEIVRRRQESIRKRVVAQNGVWGGAILVGIAAHYSLRHYDWKTKAILLPFMAYGGSWIGRWTANGVTGRWSEWGRDRSLGLLPPKVCFAA